jgi:4-hydroxy-tetrahydrodipicolinate reductase
MTIALIGYGKMGVEVERIALTKNIVVKKIFPTDREIISINKKSLRGVDVCIDFTSPTATLEIIDRVSACGVNLVVGTTGWYSQLDEAAALVRKRKTGLLYSPNFSLGMNIFFRVIREAAKAFGSVNAYDTAIHEIHHREKKDSPSGTALSLGRILLSQFPGKKELLTETSHDTPAQNTIHVTSQRTGHVVGTHTVMFDSEADSIELTHRAKNRSGFALGALVAAEWLAGKKGLFTMEDVIASL